MDPPGFSPEDAAYLQHQFQFQQQQLRAAARVADLSEERMPASSSCSSAVDEDIPSEIFMGKQERVAPLGGIRSPTTSSRKSIRRNSGTSTSTTSRNKGIFSRMKGIILPGKRHDRR